ncbi:MAG: SAM-dependent methyltransferase [Pusillimonas sp.]
MPSSNLPQPDPVAQAHLDTVTRHLHHCIQAAPGGFLPFDQWMQHALYAPGLGYYTAGSEKFGSSRTTGDFTTAPELTPLFGQALARQVAQVLREAGSNHVLEFGAGSGALAAALIPALRTLGIEPVYQILDVSADLRERQQTRLAGLGANIEWVEQLPHAFEGCVVANEVLDAMPVTLFEWNQDGQVMEIGVVNTNGFELARRPASPRLQKTVSERMPPLPGYHSELNLQAEAWVTGLGDWLHKGAALLIDYGFPRHEYYHPQRAEGTLMCHYRHHAHADALLYPGLQDITAHIDFTAMADAALAGGMEVLGYTTQARFLINCGLADLVSTVDLSDPVEHARAMGPVQKLLSEAEMGELFKVLAIGQGIDGPLTGFMQGDRRDRL